MGRFIEMFNTLSTSRKARWVGGPLVLAAAAAAVISQGQSVPVTGTAPLVNLSAEPLYARGARAKPTLTLALSVEFPTVGAQYRNATYSSAEAYVGYFDPESCYTYTNDTANSLLRRFTRSGDAARSAGVSLRTCGGTAFSGNFMNWATSSAIDVLRLGLTGGDRIRDVDGQTILQRAVIPQDFYSNGYFPKKRLLAAQVSGALPNTVGTGTEDIWIANCLNRVHFGTQDAGDCTNPGNNSNRGATLRPSDGFFYARVQVCDSSGATLNDSRTSLCQRYPSGNYKPVGNLQRYSDQLRVAAFGYLQDSSNTPQRYGGVLRAPMKYVGPRYFDNNFALVNGTNPVAEWDESTGVFAGNPVNQTTTLSGSGSTPPTSNLSGVVNYLNQFGRTGATPGQYKGYDPVGELYYESLRYLQGLTPTPEATTGLTTAMADGYPVYTAWTDPHPAVPGMTDYSCIRNNILTIGDVFTWNDKSIPGNNSRSGGVPNDVVRSANPSGNEPDFHAWTRVVGGFESNNAVTYTDGSASAVSRSTTDTAVNNFNAANAARWGMENQATGAGSSAAYYMAGMAYWANTQDIRGTGWSNTAARRPGMRVRTFMIDVNENSASSDQNFRQNTQFYLAAKYGGFRDTSGTGSPFTERLPDGTLAKNNNNWANASGEARNYFLASSAQALLNALDEIFSNLAAEANSIAGGAISTQRLTTNTGYIYQAQFDPAAWSGDLVPTSIAASGTTVTIGDVNSSPWRNAASAPSGAAGILDGRNIASSPRNIYVGYNSAASTPVFGSSAFAWASIPTSVQTALSYTGNPASAAQTDSNAQLRLNYILGDRSQEPPTGVFRRRTSRLGDIVNSGVVYSGAPSTSIPGTTYATFRTTYANRAKALFVGANDGMLHAFNADTGAEMFSYIPSWLVPKLSSLTHPSYIHQSYQDATPVVGEVNLGTTASESWSTVLVAGSGGGGQGVFALDVSNPAGFGNGNVLWEFSDRDDPAMGNVIGRPQLLKLNVGTASTPNYRWFAVVASGVNNNVADGYASSGAPALFFLRLDKAKAAAWSEGANQSGGNNYFKITFPQYTTAIANGMIGFSVRLGTAGEVSSIYAGDLHGNLWKLDMSAYVPNTTPTLSNFSYFKTGSTPLPMYTALDSSGTVRQPISMEPSLAFAANRNIIVSFGTGRFLASADNAGPYVAQSVYALLDNNTSTLDSTGSPSAAISGRGRLMQGTAAASAVSVPDFVWGRPTVDASTVSRSGWYFDYYQSGTSGERQISNFALISGRLIFGSVIPAPDACSNGNGNLYVVDLRSGDGTTTVSTVGILGEPFLVQVGASTLRASDTTGRRREQTRYQIVLQGSAGSAAPPSLSFDDITWPGRLGWREITNYQELRNTP
jgi:type IV pilus assembly protein PilY1